MTVRHLRIFAAVVDCGTMHAAAQKLYLSQPTITQAIKELEEHYGCLLFERYGRRLMITPAGQELLGHARELLSVYERMERSMKQNAGQKLLRIGATVVLAEQLLVPMVQAFEAQTRRSGWRCWWTIPRYWRAGCSVESWMQPCWIPPGAAARCSCGPSCGKSWWWRRHPSIR